jgi:exodeoxyribonuclease VII small subunit
MAKKKSFSFEDTITNLTKIVEDLESGELTLEDSLKNFEEGIALTRKAQKAIADSEQSIQLLLDSNSSDEPQIEDFVPGDKNDK